MYVCVINNFFLDSHYVREIERRSFFLSFNFFRGYLTFFLVNFSSWGYFGFLNALAAASYFKIDEVFGPIMWKKLTRFEIFVKFLGAFMKKK